MVPLFSWVRLCGLAGIEMSKEQETKPKDLKTTILVVEVILKALKMWKDWRDKRKAAKDV